jgi:hypothetical protein
MVVSDTHVLDPVPVSATPAPPRPPNPGAPAVPDGTSSGRASSRARGSVLETMRMVSAPPASDQIDGPLSAEYP